MTNVTPGGWTKGQQLMKLTIEFLDGTTVEYWVIKDSISQYSYLSDIGMFNFTEYKSVEDGDELNGMFHGGAALETPHYIPISTIKDISYSADILFGGDAILNIWYGPDEQDGYVVASEYWIENLVA